MLDFGKRLKDLRDGLKNRSIDSLLVSTESNVTYLSGFTGGDSLLFITRDRQFFLTDSRYIEEAKNSLKAFAIVEVSSSTYDAIGDIARKNRVKKIGFESMNLPYEVVQNLKSRVGRARFIPVKNAVESLRAVKDGEEIRRIRQSIAAAESTLEKVLKEVRPGVSEAYLSGRLECALIKKGARAGFQTIVACGKNTSKPHAHPTVEKISRDDVVMIDIGCRVESYNSDMTRMVFVGTVNDKIMEIYSIVKAAQEKALENIKPGRRISKVDLAGRQYIRDKGYGRFFGHSIGHGVGLDVHEEPSVSGRSKGILKPGMVFTVEPAIYIPGLGGVRIEDMVLVTDTGYEILTRFKKARKPCI